MTDVPLVAFSIHAVAGVVSLVPLWSTTFTSVSLGGTAVLVIVQVLSSPPFSVTVVTTPAPQSKPELVQPARTEGLSVRVYNPGETVPVAPPAPLSGVGPEAESVHAVDCSVKVERAREI